MAGPARASAALKPVERPERWDVPFGDNLDDALIARLLSMPPFSAMDPAAFPKHTPLTGLLRNDCRLVELGEGDLVVRAGDYGNSAFLILDGAVQVMLDPVPDTLLGRDRPRRRSVWRAIAQIWNRSGIGEVRTLGSDNTAGTEARYRRIPLSDIPGLLESNRSVTLAAGELFGEIAALGRTPRTSTVIAGGPTRLLEIRWQGLREFRRYDSGWKAQIDAVYRERSLRVQLNAFDWFTGLDDHAADTVADAIHFETHGRFDWHGSYRALKAREQTDPLGQEPVIIRQGDYLNGLIMIRSGFARVSGHYNNGERTVSYLGKGDAFGLEAFARHRLEGTPLEAPFTLRAVGYVDSLFIPTALVETHILPRIGQRQLERLTDNLRRTEALLDDVTAVRNPRSGEQHTAALEFMVEQRYINGTAAMVIDLDRCTRCDDCLRACAAAHDNNPRFVRHGRVHESLMVAQACMHCMDPVCMIGCPTGAIHRNPDGGEVIINDVACVGCATCANSCPYDNIQMVAVRDPRGSPWVDQQTGQAILKATKCDLCIDQPGGPACERACPHDALARLPLHDPEALKTWLAR